MCKLYPATVSLREGVHLYQCVISSLLTIVHCASAGGKVHSDRQNIERGLYEDTFVICSKFQTVISLGAVMCLDAYCTGHW